MSENADELLADDLGDQSLADYNLGNDEEDQLLADDYEGGGSQNVPPSMVPYYVDPSHIPHTEYAAAVEYIPQPEPYPTTEMECVVPNITVEVPNITVEVPNIPPPLRSTYAPYEPAFDTEQAVPPPMPAMPMESPQIVPSELNSPATNGGMRERFTSERPLGAQRMPLHRDIPDTLDKVVIPGGFTQRGRAHWRMTHVINRHRMYKRQHVVRPNFAPRYQFPPPQIRPIHFQHQPPNRPEFSPPRPEMGPPRHEIGPPRHEMGPPRQDMGPPRQDMGPPRQEMDQPRLEHSPQRLDFSPHKQEMVPHRPDMVPNRPEMHLIPEHLKQNHEVGPEFRPDMPMRPEIGHIRPEMPPLGLNGPSMRLPPPGFRPQMERFPNFPPNQFRPNNPHFNPNRPMFPFQQRPPFRQFRPQLGPRMPEMGPRMPEMGPRLPEMGPRMPEMRPRMPEMGLRMPGPGQGPRMPEMGARMPQVGQRIPEIDQRIPETGAGIPPIQQEVRMLPVIPPAGLAGKKVLINPHFKGSFQQSVEGPIKDIDDAAERFIAEQRNALARAATRNQPRRSPPRYIENTTIEIVNELAHPKREEADLLRRQQQFIDDNRANLRRRMRSPTRSVSPPPRRPSPSPPKTRVRQEPSGNTHSDEEFEYRRRVREQASLRARVLRAKEVRRQRNAIQYTQEKERQKHREETERNQAALDRERPRLSPIRDRSPIKPNKLDSSNENLTPPRPKTPELPQKTIEKTVDNVEKTIYKSIDKVEKSIDKADKSIDKSDKIIDKVEKTIDSVQQPPEKLRKVSETKDSFDRDMTPPLPAPVETKKLENRYSLDIDDDLDLILDDIDDILSDEDDSGRFKEKAKLVEPPPKPKPQVDLRSKLPPKSAEAKKPPKQRIIFTEDKVEKRSRDKTPPPPKKNPVTSSTNTENNENVQKKLTTSSYENSVLKSRQRIIFESLEPQTKPEPTQPVTGKIVPQVENAPNSRRVVLQRKVSKPPKLEKSVFNRIEKADPSKPNPGIFSRAVRTAIGGSGGEKNRIIIKKIEEPKVEYESDSSDDLSDEKSDGQIALVENLPHGMTDMRLRTLAGADIQTLTLDKEERTAKITFKTSSAAENFKKKFNNKMVAASRLSVVIT